MNLRIARSDDEILSCFAVLSELHPALQAGDFVKKIRSMMVEGYRRAMLEQRGEVSSVAGFRIQDLFATGRTLYVEDLVTASVYRSQGHGRTMLRWLKELGRSEDCESFCLDSATQRHEAHAFYMSQGLRIVFFHFKCKL